MSEKNLNTNTNLKLLNIDFFQLIQQFKNILNLVLKLYPA
jgi:hypothetical protein